MISVEDVKRFEEAKTCDGCLNWHKHCKAECCKVVFLNVDIERLKSPGEYLLIKLGKNLSPSDQWYYKLRDIRYTRGTLRFRKDRIVVVGRKMYYMHACSFLNDDNSCSGHPNNKPALCRALTLENSDDTKAGFFLTDNCLYKYKEKGGDEYGRTKETK